MLAVLATPGWAQMTISAPGLVGHPACGSGYVHNIDGVHLSLNVSVINTAGSQTIFANNINGVTYSFLRGLVGDGSSITSFPMKLRVINTRTGAAVITDDLGAVTSTNAVHRTTNRFDLAATTPYVAIYYADVTGLGIGNPINTICFMTGGTYTITNVSISNGSNGCFSIRPLTPRDARNCLCGRPAAGTVTIEGSAVIYDYSSIRDNWGCNIN